MDNNITLLEIALKNLVIVSAPDSILIGIEESLKWFQKHKIVRPKKFNAEGSAFGFTTEGVQAIDTLAEYFLKEHSLYFNATNFHRFVSEIESYIIDNNGNTDIKSSYNKLKDHLENWFKETSSPITHYIPCHISPYESEPFTIGPITFQTINSLNSNIEFNKNHGLSLMHYQKLLKFSNTLGANWIAELTLEGYDTIRSSEKADIATDIALTSLQLFTPSSESREIARATGRTIPQITEHYRKQAGQLLSSLSRNDPCTAYSAEYFDLHIKRNALLINSVGQRVQTFITNTSTIKCLEQAWCDAAYWFREGISEKLNTISITKMVTAIEILLFAESSQGSKDRMIKIFQSKYGLEKNQQMRSDNPRTVLKFIESITQSRSRILHGTWSTLTHRYSIKDEEKLRHEVEVITIDLLSFITTSLDEYKKSENPIDNFNSLLTWIQSKNQMQ